VKIASLGVTRNVGTRVLAELLRRGHDVTGIARNPDKVVPQRRLILKRGDVNDEAELAKILSGHVRH
jgi:putative NADH-flavin reductase